jgi:hypothetical protein
MPIATPEIYAQMLDPRSWGKGAEAPMTARVQQACEDLMFTGKQLSRTRPGGRVRARQTGGAGKMGGWTMRTCWPDLRPRTCLSTP